MNPFAGRFAAMDEVEDLLDLYMCRRLNLSAPALVRMRETVLAKAAEAGTARPSIAERTEARAHRRRVRPVVPARVKAVVGALASGIAQASAMASEVAIDLARGLAGIWLALTGPQVVRPARATALQRPAREAVGEPVRMAPRA